MPTHALNADTHRQCLVFDGVGLHARRSVFTTRRIEIHDPDAALIEIRDDPRSSFPTTADAPWDDLQVAYFASYAISNYLTQPFLAAEPGVTTTDVDAWPGADPRRRRVHIDFLPTIDTHATTQYLDIAADGLLVRLDYDADVLGGFPAINVASDFHDHGGLVIAHHRRVTPRETAGRAAHAPLLVSIDFSAVELT